MGNIFTFCRDPSDVMLIFLMEEVRRKCNDLAINLLLVPLPSYVCLIFHVSLGVYGIRDSIRE
jgi:hypothetical protein